MFYSVKLTLSACG